MPGRSHRRPAPRPDRTAPRRAATGPIPDGNPASAIGPARPGVPTPLLDQAANERLKVMPGYDKDWHQSQDALIRRVVDAFNAEKGWTPDHPHYLDPNLVKAWALQESGGHRDIFTGGDMMQVNVPGDWVPEKTWFGLEKRERIDPETSLRTALEWAYYKGEATRTMKGDTPDEGWHPTRRGTKAFPGYQSRFQGWQKALTRYNGGGVRDYFGQIDRRYKAGR